MSSMTSNPQPSGASNTIAPTDTIGCDATAASGIGRVIVVMLYPRLAQAELAYDGVAFQPMFLAGSSANAITLGKRFVFARAGGWPDPIVTMQVHPASSAGEVGKAAGGVSPAQGVRPHRGEGAAGVVPSLPWQTTAYQDARAGLDMPNSWNTPTSLMSYHLHL